MFVDIRTMSHSLMLYHSYRRFDESLHEICLVKFSFQLFHVHFFLYSYSLFSMDISCSLFQDRGILSQSFSKQTEVGYILSLGVSKDHRRNGIASLLLDNLISHLTTVEHVDCKALFLHVLTTNSPAIHFYEHRNFR
jgi:GNAT superfamily N-acetyltransferase